MKDQEGFLEQVLRIVRRRKWIVLQAIIAVPLLAFLLSISQTKEYTATATLLFREAPATLGESSAVIDPTREAATNGELVALPVVAEQAAKTLKNTTTGEVLASVGVSPSTEANTATIAATSESPERSAEIANAYGSAYIEFRRQADRAQVQEAIELAESTLNELPPTGSAGPEGAALRNQLDRLRLEQALQTGGAELVQPASPPASPSSPKTKRNVALGFVLGILLGLALAALLERIDRRVRTADEMEELYGLPLLARIPRSHLLEQKRPRPQGLSSQTREGEAFRVLRTNLRFFNTNRSVKSILFVSAEEGDGKSTVAQGLATTMTEMGDEVVLVEADLRRGSAFRGVGDRPADGLSNVLAGAPLDQVLFDVDVQSPNRDGARTLWILASGPIPPNPSELLEGDRMRGVIAELGERFPFVIIDSPALGVVSDALSLEPLASQTVVVGGLGNTTREAARGLMKQFSLLNKKPIGLVVNFAEPQRDRHSQYYRSELAGSAASR